MDQYWHNGGICGLISRTALRTLQFILAITIAALYGVDLAHWTKTSTHASSEWIYAEVVACLSALTCIIHCFATVTRVGWCCWDFVVFVLWMAQTGVFGSIYISSGVRRENEEATMSVERMEAGVWISLVCMVLWLATFVLAIGWCVRTRKVVRRTDQFGGQGQGGVKQLGDQESGCKALDADLESQTLGSDESDRDSNKEMEKSEKC
ncbi:hypothetical protein PHISP_01894 [Aspergillus sp. HF37]|nr:hypothetical protein PHISP_01894 [Aspergillus sp. HF37]